MSSLIHPSHFLREWLNAMQNGSKSLRHLHFGTWYMCQHCVLRTSLPTPVECLLQGTGGHGFDPGPRHTCAKVVIKSTICSLLGTQAYVVGL